MVDPFADLSVLNALDQCGSIAELPNLQVMSPNDVALPVHHNISDSQLIAQFSGGSSVAPLVGLPQVCGPSTILGTPRLGGILSRRFAPYREAIVPAWDQTRRNPETGPTAAHAEQTNVILYLENRLNNTFEQYNHGLASQERGFRRVASEYEFAMRDTAEAEMAKQKAEAKATLHSQLNLVRRAAQMAKGNDRTVLINEAESALQAQRTVLCDEATNYANFQITSHEGAMSAAFNTQYLAEQSAVVKLKEQLHFANGEMSSELAAQDSLKKRAHVHVEQQQDYFNNEVQTYQNQLQISRCRENVATEEYQDAYNNVLTLQQMVSKDKSSMLKYGEQTQEQMTKQLTTLEYDTCGSLP